MLFYNCIRAFCGGLPVVQGQSETLCFKNITIASRNQTGFFIGKGDDDYE